MSQVAEDETQDRASEASVPLSSSGKENRTTGEETGLEEESSPETIADQNLIDSSKPSTELENALYSILERKDRHIKKLTTEITKLRSFMTKRKQTYKRKRKDDTAPTRALSAYNLFIKDRFAELAKSNEEALLNEDSEASLKRVPPSNLVAATGIEWKELSAEERLKYEERYVHNGAFRYRGCFYFTDMILTVLHLTHVVCPQCEGRPSPLRGPNGDISATRQEP